MRRRAGPIGTCYWRQSRQGGKWTPILCEHALHSVLDLLGRLEVAVVRQNKKIARLRQKIKVLQELKAAGRSQPEGRASRIPKESRHGR